MPFHFSIFNIVNSSNICVVDSLIFPYYLTIRLTTVNVTVETGRLFTLDYFYRHFIQKYIFIFF